jgi:PadR family transcriptional regulator PadR
MVSKDLVAASAEPLILSLLEKGESYGYAIIQEIKGRSEEQLTWTDGMLYPVLHRMEAKGLIKSRWVKTENGRKRKYYSLKQDGKRALQRHFQQWDIVNSVLSGLRKEQHV